jgi:FkbM family methyltransferase
MVRQRLFLAYQRIRLSSPFFRRAVNVVPGARALHRLLFSRLRPSEITLDVRGLSITVDTRDAVIGAHLIRDGVWEPYETEMFELSITPGMVVADIGANIGYYTLLAARAVGPSGRVISFEPDPRNLELLRRNLAANGFGDRVTVIDAAIGDRSGSITLYRHAFNFGAHSVAEANASGEAPLDVVCLTLDEALMSQGVEHLDVLKIDTQGSEGKIFKGGNAILSTGPLRAFTEFWPQGLRAAGTDPASLLEDFVSHLGLRMRWMDHNGRKLVDMATPHDVLSRCAGDTHVDLLLERT